MYSMFIFMDKFTNPILPPLMLEKDCGKYINRDGSTGRVYLVSGNFEDLMNFITSHNEIWLGFHDSCTEENLILEKWIRPQ